MRCLSLALKQMLLHNGEAEEEILDLFEDGALEGVLTVLHS